MKVVILGPQGAGKGTQAQAISEETGAEHIATGDLVRAEIKSSSELGEQIKDYNDRGELVPDETIIEMTMPYLEQNDSWLLDGFPRNEAQAQALDEALDERDMELDAAIVLEASDEELVQRLSGRRQSEATGEIYHVEHDPPPEDDEEDPGPFVQRDDDTEESIQRRLEIYHEQTEPLKSYYAEKNILASIDATQDIPEVMEDVMAALNEETS
ncbi:adenylate kinase [soil metagenome]|jgi:adenylate kinase